MSTWKQTYRCKVCGRKFTVTRKAERSGPHYVVHYCNQTARNNGYRGQALRDGSGMLPSGVLGEAVCIEECEIESMGGEE